MTAFIEWALQSALGAPDCTVLDTRPLGGGCISQAAVVQTTAGRFFVKWNDAAPPDLFEREADGLRALADAASPLAIPAVVGAFPPDAGRPALIIMEYLEPEGAAGDDDRLGHGLAVVHRQRTDAFGFAVHSYCGATPQTNTWTPGWVDFFREHRIEALVRAIERTRGVPDSWSRPLRRVIDRLPVLLPHEPDPSLIHGDLWSGNVLHTSRGPGLIDPACAYADREMEFGITTLFGGFSARFWDAYQDAWPLPDEWRERNAIYQLYHLLNHYLLFGGHYGAEALAILRAHA